MPTLGALTKRVTHQDITPDLEELILAVGRLEERLRWFKDGPPRGPLSSEAELQTELIKLRHQLLDFKSGSQTPPSFPNPLVTQSLNHPVNQSFSRLENLKGSIRNQPSGLSGHQTWLDINPIVPRDTARVPSSQTGESSSIPSPHLPLVAQGAKWGAGEGQGEGKLCRWSAATQASPKHPNRNDDQWLVTDEANGFGVFDGIGKDAAAGRASQLVADSVREAFEALAKDPNPPELTKALAATLLEAHLELQRQDDGQDQPCRLTTTATIGVLTKVPFENTTSPSSFVVEPAAPADTKKTPSPLEGEGWGEGVFAFTYSFVGDSRISLWSKQTGQFRVITFDDGLLRLLLQEPTTRPGWLPALLEDLQLDPSLVLSAAEAAKLATVLDLHPDPRKVSPLTAALFAERSLVTQSLGNSTARPHIGTLPVQSGDRLLLATDGVHDNLTEMEIKKVIAEAPLKEAAQKLVTAASSVSQSTIPRAKPDDITAIVIEIR